MISRSRSMLVITVLKFVLTFLIQRVTIPDSNEYRAAFFVDHGAVYELSSIHLHSQNCPHTAEFEQSSLSS
ncbi:hypothetical protein EG68_09890 [Paragonimus skrjabini miyazakii]|nr:hypothetical protein EG68_09890 [Paragonimus skrjabini miyazakii]